MQRLWITIATISVLGLVAVIWMTSSASPPGATHEPEETTGVPKASPSPLAAAPQSPWAQETDEMKTASTPLAVAPASMPGEPTGMVGAATPTPVAPFAISPQLAEMEQRFGLYVTEVTANRNAVIVRFTISDQTKAGALMSLDTEHQVIDAKSGTRLSLVSTPRRPARIQRTLGPGGLGQGQGYTLIFDNSKGVIKPGDKVSVVMDQYRVDGLAVR